MLTASFQTHGVQFAFLVGPPRTLSCQEGMQTHGKTRERLGVEDISFRYSPGTESQGPHPAPSPESRANSSAQRALCRGQSLQFQRRIGHPLKRGHGPET